MSEQLEQFEHKPRVMTVGDLRKAMADMPDEMELWFSPTEEPGGDRTGIPMIAHETTVEERVDIQDQQGHPVLVVELDFSPGTYERIVEAGA